MFSVYVKRIFQPVFCLQVQGIRAMKHIFSTLACCLLFVSFVKAKPERRNSNLILSTTPVLNTTAFVTSSNSTVTVSNGTENTTPFTSTRWDNKTLNETTSHTQTSQSTTIVTALSDSTSLMTTLGTNTPGFTALTTPAVQTTSGYNSTTNTTAITTVYSSQIVNTTSHSEVKSTQGKRVSVILPNNNAFIKILPSALTYSLFLF